MLESRRWAILFLVPLLLCQAAWAKPGILGVRLGIHPGLTRVVIEVSEATPYRVGLLASPPRLTIELPESDWQGQQLPKVLGQVRSLGMSSENGVTKLTAVVRGPVKLGAVTMIAGSVGPEARRLVIDLMPATNGEFASALMAEPVDSNPPLIVSNLAAASPAPIRVDPKPAALAVAGAPAAPWPAGTPTLKPVPDAGPAPTAPQTAETVPAVAPSLITSSPIASSPIASSPIASSPAPTPVNPASPVVATAAPDTWPAGTPTLKPVPQGLPPLSAPALQAAVTPPAVAPNPAAPQIPSPAPAATPVLVSAAADTGTAAPPPAAGTTTAGLAIRPLGVPTLRPRIDNLPLVYIDPGHGGPDPGTIGHNGTYEKNVTLAVARELQRQLLATGRYRVKLTRNADVYVPLRARFEMARDDQADIFISLHADSSFVGDPRGASVYTLSETSSDDEAAALAAKENKSDLIAGVDLTRQNAVVASILIDLTQRETKNMSAHLAELMVDQMRKVTLLLPNTHRFAGFAVLKAPDIPSILIEMGYLSNIQDEALLLSAQHRANLAGAMLRAVDGYFAPTVVSSRS